MASAAHSRGTAVWLGVAAVLPLAVALVLAAVDVREYSGVPRIPCPMYPNAVVSFAAELHEGCPLEPGDAVLALASADQLMSIDSSNDLDPHLRERVAVELVIRRAGEAADRRFLISPVATPSMTAIAQLASSALLATLLVAFVLLTAVRSGVPAAQPFAAIHSCMGVLIVAAVAGWTSSRSYPLTALARVVLPAAIVHLSFVFPRMREVAVRVPGIHRVTYGVALGLLLLELDATYRGSASTMFLIQRIEIAGTAVAVSLLCFSSWLSMRESPSRLERGQARVFLTGLGVLLVATLGGTLVVPGGSMSALTLGAALSPIPLGYAIASYHLFDFGTTLRRVVGHALYLSIWSGLFFLGVMLVREQLPIPEWLRHPVVAFAGVYGVLAPLDGVRHLLKRFIERAFLPEAKTWAKLSEGRASRIAHLRDVEAIGRAAVTLASDGLRNAGISLFLASDSGLRLVYAQGPDACEDPEVAARARRLAAGGDVVDLNRVDTVEAEAAAVYEAGVEIVSVISTGDEMLGVMLVCPQKRGAPHPAAPITWLRVVGVHTAAALENARLTEQLRVAEQFAIRGRMHAELAHEIGKPLGALERLAQKLSSDPNAEASVHERASAIARISGQLRDIVRGVLDAGRSIDRIEVPDLLERACAEVATVHGDGRVLVRPAPALPALDRHAERVVRALTNLIDNALRASQPGETVEVRVRDAEGCVVIEVVDRGCGLAPEDTERVFDAFVSLRADGNGLGLTISRQIVEQVGGTLELESVLGKGTIARMRLPAGAPDDG
jgi:nitrogen-specific signal transduction histidine kinase